MGTDYLLFDSWYAGVQHLRWYHRRGIRFVTAIKNNRTVRLLSIPTDQRPLGVRKTTRCWGTSTPHQVASAHPHSRDYHSYPAIDGRTRRWESTLEGYSEGLSLVCIKNYAAIPAFKALVTKAEKKQKDPNKYLLTNDTSLTVVQIVEWYRRRWALEVLFRDCKQFLGLSAYQGQTVDAHSRHIGCVFLSYVLTEQMKAYAAPTLDQAHTLTIGQVKEWLNTQYLLRAPYTPVSEVTMVGLFRFSEANLIELLEQTNLPSETANQPTPAPQH